ncbi:hypothetical protein ES705_47763 [subsurface metagenome]
MELLLKPLPAWGSFLPAYLKPTNLCPPRAGFSVPGKRSAGAIRTPDKEVHRQAPIEEERTSRKGPEQKGTQDGGTKARPPGRKALNSRSLKPCT